MQKTLALSENVIKQHAGIESVLTLVDAKTPLEIRFHKSRLKATWSYVYYRQRQKKRERLGYWPTLKVSDAKAIIPTVVNNLIAGAKNQQSEFTTVGHVLSWYLERVKKESLKSSSRRSSVVSVINRHLMPNLSDLALQQVNKLAIDERFVLPLQQKGLRPASIRSYFSALKKVFKTALDLGLISINPLAAMSFRDHVQQRIEPKPGKLLVSDAEQTLKHIMQQSPKVKMLLLFMFMFATRLGETRQMKWAYIDFNKRQINIPAEITKTQHVHILPLTEQAIDILKQYQQARPSNTIYLFGSSKPLSASKADKLIRETTKQTYSAHDLRKLARSIWAHIGIDYWVAERLLNHKQKGLDAVYIKADSMDVKMKALTQYHEYILYKNVGDMQSMKNNENNISN